MNKKQRVAAVVTALIVVAVTVSVSLAGRGGYKLRLVMPSAAQLVAGGPVWIKGIQVGKIANVQSKDGKAIVTVNISGDDVPLHDGTTTRIEWKSVLGERIVTINPGPAQNPVIPSGAMYASQSSEIELDEALAVMDAPTRARLNSMFQGLRQTTSGQENNIRATLRTAGPTVQALGSILKGVGQDGPAIHTLITQLDRVVGSLASRQDDVSGSIDNLARFTGSVAERTNALSAGLSELPSTLRTAKATLDRVPAASQSAIPLLNDLKPTMIRLPSIARSLRPLLRDLRPAMHDLRPTLDSAADLLRYTPGFIDRAHDVLPPLRHAADQFTPAVRFLRPYSPEIAGVFGNWAQDFAGYDSQGHVWGAEATLGPLQNDENVAVVPPPLHVSRTPAPGESVRQPWVDANGDGVN
jgi:phospholipid/cholesterol/gamma-HCH transport system substrate-binding protein